MGTLGLQSLGLTHLEGSAPGFASFHFNGKLSGMSRGRPVGGTPLLKGEKCRFLLSLAFALQLGPLRFPWKCLCVFKSFI